MLNSNKINILVLKNPFNIDDKELFQAEYIPDKSLKEYITPYTFGIEELVVAMNGHSIAKEDFESTFPQPSDCISVCASVQGGGDKNPLAVIASLALTVWVGGLYTPGQVGFLGVQGGTFMAGLVQAGLMMIGGAIIQSLFPAPNKDLGNTTSEQSYGWGQLQSIQGQGGAVARTYGTVRTAGTLIGHHITTDGTKQYLNLLYTGGEGYASSISDIQIEGNPIENYHDIEYDVRLGFNVQEPINFFDFTSDDQAFSYELVPGNDWSTQRTEGSGGEALEFTIAFPNGLYYINNDGNKEDAEVVLEVQYKKVGDTNWIPYSTNITSKKTMYYDPDTGIQYETNDPNIIVDEGINFGDNKTIYLRDNQGNLISYLSEIKIDVYSTTSQYHIKGTYDSSYYIVKKIDKLPRGQYDLRVRCVSKSGTTYRYATRVYFAGLSHIIYKTFYRPRKILLAIRALATDQLSGSVPNVTWKQTVDKVFVWNPDRQEYQAKPANNPAWATYDILASIKPLQNPNILVDGYFRWDYINFGCKKERMDFHAFSAWADRCTTMNLTFNYQFTSSSDMWEALRKPETCGRGKIVVKGTSYTCIFDAPKSPAQMFTVGNTTLDSFSESFLSNKERANCIEVSFLNKNKNYEKDVAVAYGSSWDTDPQNPTQITLDGCDNYEMAFRYASYLIRCNEYFIRTVSFSADVDSIVSQVGDAIYVQSSVFDWGYGGRLEEFTTSTVTLNEPVIMLATKQYSIMIRYRDGSMVTKEVKNVLVDSEMTTIELATPFTILPEKHDVYSFGEVNKVAKPMLISNITRDSSQRRKITCLEFDNAVYEESDVITIPEYSYTAATISLLNLDEDGYMQSSGNRISILKLDWTILNPNRMYCRTEVQIKKSQDEAFVAQGIYTGNRASITGVIPKTTYIVRARLISILGTPICDWVTNSLYVTGVKDIPPSDMISLNAVQRGQNVIINGVFNQEPDYSHIEIRKGGTSWDNALVISTGKGSQLPVTLTGLYDGSYVFRAKVVDLSGLYSLNEAACMLDVAGVDAQKNIVLSKDFILNHADLTLTGFAYKNGILESVYDRVYSQFDKYNNSPTYYLEDPSQDIYTTATIESKAVDMGAKKTFTLGIPIEWMYITINTGVKYAENVNLYVSFSNNGTDWTSWSTFMQGDYSFRYFKFKMEFGYNAFTTKIRINSMRAVVEAPTINLSETISVPQYGQYIVFTDLNAAYDFMTIPTDISALPIDNFQAVFVDVSSVTTDGLYLRCYNKDGASIASKVKLNCKGY